MGSQKQNHVDVLIVGAGLSGISAAYHLQQRCPHLTFLLWEARSTLGGTWDLFRYPGIRSDSDMYTLGYSFKPWKDPKAIADGPSILSYIKETAEENKISSKIRYNAKATSAAWDSATAQWQISGIDTSSEESISVNCSFVYMCSGYYNYDHGYTPEFPGSSNFSGTIIHPQKWPEALDYKDKNVVVIGSGATAVTLVPEMARAAAHVTMLQRSPTYIVSRPAEDAIANFLRKYLPLKLAYGIARWKNILFGMIFFNLARKKPAKVKEKIIQMVRDELGNDFDVDKHFTPRYNPWDQRVCLVPDSDLFNAINKSKASVVTDEIKTFTETGIELKSGEFLEADIIVTATGLELKFMAGLKITVDGVEKTMSEQMSYRGMMYNDIPNLAVAFGYTNASWTLKCDLTCEYVCRLLNHLRSSSTRQVTPRLTDDSVKPENALDFTSGYVLRGIDQFPHQGDRAPWKLHQNYALDILNLRYSRLEDGVLEFS